MDPLALIVTAIVAGAAAATKETTSTAIKDAYNGLKALIQRRLQDKQMAEAFLAEIEKKPEVSKMPLEETLRDCGADGDEAVLRSAKQLLELVRSEDARVGKFAISITNAQGVVIGDRAHVEQHFGDKHQQE